MKKIVSRKEKLMVKLNDNIIEGIQILMKAAGFSGEYHFDLNPYDKAKNVRQIKITIVNDVPKVVFCKDGTYTLKGVVETGGKKLQAFKKSLTDQMDMYWEGEPKQQSIGSFFDMDTDKQELWILRFRTEY